jgi:hypothetical protein
MQTKLTASPLTISKSGVCVVDGYGISLRVERGRLVVSDGIVSSDVTAASRAQP